MSRPRKSQPARQLSQRARKTDPSQSRNRKKYSTKLQRTGKRPVRCFAFRESFILHRTSVCGPGRKIYIRLRPLIPLKVRTLSLRDRSSISCLRPVLNHFW